MDYKLWILGLIFRLVLVVNWYKVRGSEYTKQVLQNTSEVGEILTNTSISLAFVFDRTGSMYDDLLQVRAGATRIFNKTINTGDSPVRNYILVPFRDPDVGPAFQTKDPAKFVNALNDIYVRGGKDCPEMSVTAIKRALELSLPGSVIYVFTDAEAKDHRVLPEVIRLVKQKKVRINFILTGNCGLDKNFTDRKTYEKIATFSSGQIVNLNKSEVRKIWEFVEVSINPNRRNIYSVDKLTRGERTYVVEVDKFIDIVVITVSGKNVEVAIRDSSGELVFLKDENVDVLLNLDSVVSLLINDPRPGNWSITVRSNGKHTLRVEAISEHWKKFEPSHSVVVIPEIDECTRGIHDCKSEERCLDLPYGFTCEMKCQDGYEMTRGVCADVDECVQRDGICGPGDRKCVNTRGSYRCIKICRQGFQGRRNKCIDINECSHNPTICGDEECFNTMGGYRCQEKCLQGFMRDENGNCKDVNECSKYASICGSQECVNIQGSYRCLEKCPRGLVRNRNGDCKDTNECSKYPSICGSRDCINIHGSYRCLEKCLRGFTRDEDGSCKDTDECSQNPTICGDHDCINTPGNYRCQRKCSRGFTHDENDSCKDVDECVKYSEVCGNKDCVNIPGSYRCEDKCMVGFKRDRNGNCKDVDECLEQPQRCGHMCENTVGGFRCLCQRGTRLASDGTTCLRTNACPLRGYGRCQYQCNTVTGRCECPRGYRLHWDERSCIDINECLTGDNACGTRECFNTLGKYHCLNVSCPQSYYPTTDGYCTMQCFYQANQCSSQYTKLQHTSISIPRDLPVNTDFLHLQPYIPQVTNMFCAVYFYPVQESNHLFGVYQIDETGILYNRVVFNDPGFYQFRVVSDYLDGFGNILSRTTFQVFVDVGDYTF